jgi:hypothetical protein
MTIEAAALANSVRFNEGECRNARRGTLDRLDPIPGAPQRRYEIAPFTEGIGFGNAGRLWVVSEAGSRHIYDHPFLGLFQPFFPLVFALDLSRLE